VIFEIYNQLFSTILYLKKKVEERSGFKKRMLNNNGAKKIRGILQAKANFSVHQCMRI
jgi:hypothetical protein